MWVERLMITHIGMLYFFMVQMLHDNKFVFGIILTRKTNLLDQNLAITIITKQSYKTSMCPDVMSIKYIRLS